MVEQDKNESAEDSIGVRMAEGAAWVVFMRLAIRTLGVLSMVILARLLEPSDYGLIALATMLAAAVELLSRFNFEVWLIRRSHAEREHYDTVWTLAIMQGFLTALILWLIAGSMASFFDDPRLEVVVRIIACSLLMSSMQNVGIVDFQRDLQFNKDFVFNGSAKFGAFIVTVTLGFILRNYWALVAGIVTTNLIRLILSYVVHAYRPRLSLRHWREAFDFSKWLLVGSLLGFVHLRADTFILGKVAGGQVLGLYNVAREIANLATTELVTPIRRVMLPGYSKMQHDGVALRDSFVQGFALIMLIGAPCAVGLGVLADPLIRVLLGSKWLEAIPIMQALALYGVTSIGMANQWPALVATGRTKIASGLLAAGAVWLLPSLYYASLRYGALGGALALGISNTVLFLAGLVAVQRVLSFRWRALWASIWRVILATLLMALAVLLVQNLLTDRIESSVLTLVACIIVGAGVYTLTLLLMRNLFGANNGPEQAIADFIRYKFDKSVSGNSDKSDS